MEWPMSQPDCLHLPVTFQWLAELNSFHYYWKTVYIEDKKLYLKEGKNALELEIIFITSQLIQLF